MKMAAVREIFLLLLCCSLTSSAGSSECSTYAATGANITLNINKPIDQIFKLSWKHGTKVIANRAKDGTVNLNDKKKKTGLHQNGSLELTGVQKDQAGTYKPEAFSPDGMSVSGLESIQLCVLDPVPKPNVTQTCLKANIDVQFTCSIKSATDGVTYKWFQDGKEVEKQTSKTLKLKTQAVIDTPIMCTVANQASQKSSDPVKQTCVASGFVFPEKVLGLSVWIFVAGGGGIVIVLILITIICCIRARRKKTMRVKDEEELRLGWTNPQQHQHQHQHQHNHPPDHAHAHRHQHHQHHHQQQPAGHTGPRQQRAKQPRPRAPDPLNGQPQPSPRRAQPPKPPVDDDEQPPPLPQPRKKGPRM